MICQAIYVGVPQRAIVWTLMQTGFKSGFQDTVRSPLGKLWPEKNTLKLIESLGIEFIVKCKIPPGLMIRNLKYFPRLAWIKWDRSSDRGHQRSVSRISHGASLQHFQTQPHSIIVIFPQKDFAWKLLHISTYFPQWLLHISSKLNHLDQTRMRMMLSTLWWDYPHHFLTATAQGRKFCIMIFGDFALTVSR